MRKTRQIQERYTTSFTKAYLHVALGDIERGDTCVRDTASNDTAEHALGVVGAVMGDRAEVTIHHWSAFELLASASRNTTHRASHFPGVR